jgi:hypothetical protein
MPSGIATNLQRWQDSSYIEIVRKSAFRLKTPEQVAATSVLPATSPELKGLGGRYYEDCAEAPSSSAAASGAPAASRLTRSTPPTPSGSGSCRSACSRSPLPDRLVGEHGHP